MYKWVKCPFERIQRVPGIRLCGAMFSNTTGSENVALGRFSLSDNTTGSDNVAIGDEALQNMRFRP